MRRARSQAPPRRRQRVASLQLARLRRLRDGARRPPARAPRSLMGCRPGLVLLRLCRRRLRVVPSRRFRRFTGRLRRSRRCPARPLPFLPLPFHLVRVLPLPFLPPPFLPPPFLLGRVLLLRALVGPCRCRRFP